MSRPGTMPARNNFGTDTWAAIPKMIMVIDGGMMVAMAPHEAIRLPEKTEV